MTPRNKTGAMLLLATSVALLGAACAGISDESTQKARSSSPDETTATAVRALSADDDDATPAPGSYTPSGWMPVLPAHSPDPGSAPGGDADPSPDPGPAPDPGPQPESDAPPGWGPATPYYGSWNPGVPMPYPGGAYAGGAYPGNAIPPGGAYPGGAIPPGGAYPGNAIPPGGAYPGGAYPGGVNPNGPYPGGPATGDWDDARNPACSSYCNWQHSMCQRRAYPGGNWDRDHDGDGDDGSYSAQACWFRLSACMNACRYGRP